MSFKISERLREMTEELKIKNKPWHDYCDSNTLATTTVHLLHTKYEPIHMESIEARIWYSCWTEDGEFKHNEKLSIQFGDGYWSYYLSQKFVQDTLSAERGANLCVDAGAEIYIPKKEVAELIREVLPKINFEDLPTY